MTDDTHHELVGADVPLGHPEQVPMPVIRRAIAASALGNATEWFDYGIYAYGVVYLSAALFPGDTAEATLFALATFAISFLVRPLGGLFWGPLGDRYGRKTILAYTIILMSAATVCVGLIPSYDDIGFWAPALLVLLRMIQGFSTGGEYGGAATFMAEYSPDDRRGFYGSFLEFGTLAGFSFGALLMLGMYLRSRMEDTPIFREIEAHHETEPAASTELRHLLTRYWRPLVTMGGLVIALNVVNYTLLSYMPTYLQRRLSLSADDALIVPIIGMLFMMLFVPLAGRLSDSVGRKPLWWFSLVGLFIGAVPLYLLMAGSFAGAVAGFALLGLLYVPQLATISATFPAMFPTHVRFAGFAISYNVATSLFGGTAPAFNSWLIGATGDELMPAYVMMAACVVGMVALRFTPETAGKSLRGTETPGYRGTQRKPGAQASGTAVQ
jgi:MHS family proline/betaine transporter-like MFS transporter